jgi:hypothetical protein
MNRNERKRPRGPSENQLDEPATPANEFLPSMPRGFIDSVTGCYVRRDSESASWSELQDDRDQRELNPHGIRPPKPRHRGKDR